MSEDAGKLGLEPRVDVAYELTTRLTELESKVESQRKSLWALLGTAAGVLGFFLSTITGIFTLDDQIIRKPDEDRIAEYNAFKGDIRSIISINEDAVKTPNMAGFANQKIQSILQDVNRLLRLLGPGAMRKDGKYFIGSYDYSILSQASYQGGNVDATLKFAEESVRAADNTHTRSEALRTEAFMIMQARGEAGESDAVNALNQADRALDEATENEMPSYAIAFDRAFLYVTRSWIDGNVAKCGKAADEAGKALSLVSPKDNPMMNVAYEMVAKQIASGILGEQCPISSFPAVIQYWAASMAARPGETPLATAGGVGGANPLQTDATAGGVRSPTGWPSSKAK